MPVFVLPAGCTLTIPNEGVSSLERQDDLDSPSHPSIFDRDRPCCTVCGNKEGVRGIFRARYSIKLGEVVCALCFAWAMASIGSLRCRNFQELRRRRLYRAMYG